MFNRLLSAFILAGCLAAAQAQDATPASVPASSPATAASKPAKTVPTFPLKVSLQLEEPAELTARNVKLGLFPGGNRCAFTYCGASAAATVDVLSKLGFKTTIYVDPSGDPARLRELEQAGADLGVNIWGGKGNYSSNIGANTIQEAFDACVTSRMVLRKKVQGPLACSAIGGHYSTQHFPISRDPDNGSGFGYAYHDSNYLMLTDNKDYMIYLGREGERVLANRENFDNRMPAQNVPNEIVYYSILANIFRGTVSRAEKGQIVRLALRDFKAPDLKELTRCIGPYGKQPGIWHASEADLGANEYVRAKARLADVKVGGDQAELVLAIDQDIFPPFLLSAFPLELPKGVKVKSAAINGVACNLPTNGEGNLCLDVPLRQVLAEGVAMSIETGAPDMTVPDEMDVTLTIRNTGDKPLKNARLQWIGNINMGLVGGTDAAFDLDSQAEKKIQAKARTTAGARFGITPFRAMLSAQRDGAERLLMEGFELVVAPRLRVEVDPMQSIPLPKGRSQHFFVHIDNQRGKSNLFVSHKTGPCKGAVSFDLPEGMSVEPKEQPFELGESASKTLIFKITNSQWSAEPAMAKPIVRFEGEKEPVCVLFPGTILLRDEAKVGVKPLDESGLLVQASWDDNSKGGAFDRACGNPRPYFYPGHMAAYNNEGVKGWCMNTARCCEIFDTFKNIDFYQGTACFYMRKDPFVRNENTFVGTPADTAKMSCGRNNNGEMIFSAGGVQNVSSSDSGITLRRFRSWQGKPGYLQLTYQMMGHKLVSCYAEPFNWTEDWRHVALLWSVKDRRLELYIDGKLAAKADPGQEDWYAAPWDRGRWSGWQLQVITSDHGNWTGTCRDELYIYNRPLSSEEILANKALAEKK